MPVKSGFPSAARGAGDVFGGVGAPCAASSRGSAPSASQMFFMPAISLVRLSLVDGRNVAAVAGAGRRTGEQFLAVRESHLARVRPVGAVARPPAGNGDGIARLHRDFPLPSGAVENIRREAFELPVG